MVTYATSSTFGILVRDLDVPIVLVALQPLKALDYARASTYMQLANDDFCSVPEFTGVAIRMGKRPPPVILGTLDDDPQADAEIAEWCDIAKVLHDLQVAPASATSATSSSHMLDMQTDPTAFTAAFGCHIVQTEADDLLRCTGTASPSRDRGQEAPDPRHVRHARSQVRPDHPQAHRRGPRRSPPASPWRWTVRRRERSSTAWPTTTRASPRALTRKSSPT